MPPILLGVLAALFVGISDTFGRASSRRANSVSHVSTQMFVGIFVALPLVLLIESTFLIPDIIMGSFSGLCVGIGLAIVYQAMADSSSAIAAPTAGVVSALLPLLWDVLVRDASLSWLAAVGCVVAIASLGIVSYNPSMGNTTIRNGLAAAVVGGMFFGGAVIFAGDTTVESGVWPAAAQRLVAFLAMVLLAKHREVSVFLPSKVRMLGVWGGIAGALGMASFVIGSQQGDLGTISVVLATYPAVIVVLATLFDHDEIKWWQGIGIAGAIAGTALIALG